jgi:hypothetical protein
MCPAKRRTGACGVGCWLGSIGADFRERCEEAWGWRVGCAGPAEGIGAVGGQSLIEHPLGDFTLTLAAARLVPLAVVVGGLSALVALLLLDMIGLVTNLAYYGRLSASLVQPSFDRFGAFAVAIPVVGGGLVGLMAYFGSERIRGHGIPEAMVGFPRFR